MSHTEQEIFSQPAVWKDTLSSVDLTDFSRIWRRTAPASALVTGCGSTFYLSLTLASLLREHVGISARATPASEMVIGSSAGVSDPGETILIAISRSGMTSETLAAVNRFKEIGGGAVVAITNFPASSLAELADVVIAAPAGQEESVAQTRSFSTMLLAAQAAVGSLAGEDLEQLDRLPDLAEGILESSVEKIAPFTVNSELKRFFFLGSGSLYGVASEGMLKLKEMSLTDSESFHSLEFRHGPMSMADAEAAVFGLISPDRVGVERAVIADAAGFGSRTVELGSGMVIDIPDSLPGWARPTLYLLPLQVLALERARYKGLDPDKPRNLVAVIQLENIGARSSE